MPTMNNALRMVITDSFIMLLVPIGSIADGSQGCHWYFTSRPLEVVRDQAVLLRLYPGYGRNLSPMVAE
jgi:hypothetical protein